MTPSLGAVRSRWIARSSISVTNVSITASGDAPGSGVLDMMRDSTAAPEGVVRAYASASSSAAYTLLASFQEILSGKPKSASKELCLESVLPVTLNSVAMLPMLIVLSEEEEAGSPCPFPPPPPFFVVTSTASRSVAAINARKSWDPRREVATVDSTAASFVRRTLLNAMSLTAICAESALSPKCPLDEDGFRLDAGASILRFAKLILARDTRDMFSFIFCSLSRARVCVRVQ